jgi:hypothetical protein
LSSAGSLDTHLNQYVPAHWLSGDQAIALFSSAVYLQILHYVAVIYVLPRLGAKSEEAACKSVVNWPSPGKCAGFVAVAGAIACTAFWASFADARAFYSLAAAVHAWIEIPLLLLAFVPATAALESAPSLP